MIKKSRLILISLVTLLSLPLLANANSKTSSKYSEKVISQKYSNISEDQIIQEFKRLDIPRLFREVNLLFQVNKEKDADYITGYSMLFLKSLDIRLNEVSNEIIIKNILNDNNSLEFRILMIDLFTYKNHGSSTELKKLISKDLDRQVNARLVITCSFSNDDIPLLKDLLNEYENDEDTYYQIFKVISNTNRLEAYNISKSILNDYTKIPEYKVTPAIRATGHYFGEHKNISEEERTTFISLCVNIINSNKVTPLRDASIYALSDMRDATAILEIINNKFMQDSTKSFCISQNYKVLESILLNNPSEKDIESILNAMKISPIKNLIPSLEKCKGNIKNKDLLNKYNEILEYINKNGSNVNPEW